MSMVWPTLGSRKAKEQNRNRWRWALVSPDGLAPSRMVGVSASVNLPLHHKVQKFSAGTGSPGWSQKKGRKTGVVWRGVVERKRRRDEQYVRRCSDRQ